MDIKEYRNFVNICFWLCLAISAILVIYIFIGMFIFGHQMNAWFGLFMGITFLLFVPKLHLGVIEKEENNPKIIDSIGRKGCFIFFFGGCLLILGALYDFFIR